MPKNKTKQTSKRYGIFYKSHNKLTGPYAGITYSKFSLTRNPAVKDIQYIKNYILKNKIQLLPVN